MKSVIIRHQTHSPENTKRYDSMLPAMIWVNPPTKIRHVISVMTWNRAPSAPGISQNRAGNRNVAWFAPRTAAHLQKPIRLQLISSQLRYMALAKSGFDFRHNG